MKVAVVGATGLVGTKMLQVLAERGFPVTELFPVASEKSVGKEIVFKGKKHRIIGIPEAIAMKPDIAIFSAGGQTSLDWAPAFAEVGTFVIDNSSAWRMEPGIPLVIPEINAGILRAEDKIIANPNCSTIQMLVALGPIHRTFGIKRVVVSTYQSITGTGVKAVRQLEREEEEAWSLIHPTAASFGKEAGSASSDKNAYPHAIYRNCIPQCDVFLENGYTKEEMKLVNETRKILGDEGIQVTATAVRVPVVGGHSEAVNIELKKPFVIAEIRALLAESPGIILEDDPAESLYPMPRTAHESDSVYVGRIRRDNSIENGLNLWIVSDNLRKGAATNAIQIAEYLIENNLVG